EAVMSPVESRDIAAGSLPIGIEESNLIPELWSLPQLREWRAFGLPGDTSHESAADGKYLPPDVQQRLLKAPKLSPLSRLFRARWVNLDFMVTGDVLATVRVYLLPDDVQRATVDRAVP